MLCAAFSRLQQATGLMLRRKMILKYMLRSIRLPYNCFSIKGLIFYKGTFTNFEWTIVLTDSQFINERTNKKIKKNNQMLFLASSQMYKYTKVFQITFWMKRNTIQLGQLDQTLKLTHIKHNWLWIKLFCSHFKKCSIFQKRSLHLKKLIVFLSFI